MFAWISLKGWVQMVTLGSLQLRSTRTLEENKKLVLRMLNKRYPKTVILQGRVGCQASDSSSFSVAFFHTPTHNFSATTRHVINRTDTANLSQYRCIVDLALKWSCIEWSPTARKSVWSRRGNGSRASARLLVALSYSNVLDATRRLKRSCLP